MSLSFGGITPVPQPVPQPVTEKTMANLKVPVARRLAFVLSASLFSAVFLGFGLTLTFNGYLGSGPGSAGVVGVLLGFGCVLVLVTIITALIHRSRKTLIRREYIYPAKAPESVKDAWVTIGFMAGVGLIVCCLLAALGAKGRENFWSDFWFTIQGLAPVAGSTFVFVSLIFLASGYCLEYKDRIFKRWLAKRPLAQQEYAELMKQLDEASAQTQDRAAPTD